MRLSLSIIGCGVLASCGLGSANLEDLGDAQEEHQGELRALSQSEIVGDITPGATETVAYSASPRYRALRFTAPAATRVDIWVRTSPGDANAWLLASNFATIRHNDDSDGSSDSHLQATLRSGGTFYVAFREYKGRAATFSVSLDFISALDGGSGGDSGVPPAPDAGAPLVDAGPPALKLIDWCANGVDEDGDGFDRPCTGSSALPIELRQLVLDSPPNDSRVGLIGETSVPAWTSGGTYDTPTATVAFPRNVISKVRLQNRSPYGVQLHPWPLYPGAWDILFDPQDGPRIDSSVFEVTPGHSYRINAGGFTLYMDVVFSEGQSPALESQKAVLEGSMTDSWNRTTPVRVTVIPEVGEHCGSQKQNSVTSINQCAGIARCLVWSRINVETLSATREPSLVAAYLPPQCSPPPPPGSSYPPTWRSSLIWENGHLSISGSMIDTGRYNRISLYSDRATPSLITGEAEGSYGDYFAGGGARFSLRFVPNQ